MRARAGMTIVGRSALVAAGVVALAGCGETTIKTAEDPPPASQTFGTAPAADGGSGSLGATVGGSITLRGTDDGALMRVTAVGVRDPVSAGDSFIQPDPGNRCVGVRVRLRNVGTANYSDSPSNGASVVD